jgi:hypothetical protein
VGFRIQPDILPFQHFSRLRRAHAAQMCAQACHQFGHGIGLDDVIIRARLKAANLVDLFRTRREHQNRDAPRLGPRPDAAAHLNPRDMRHHPVQKDQVRQALGQPLHRLFTVCRADHGKAVGLKVIAQDLALRRFVLDQKDNWLWGGHQTCPPSPATASTLGRASAGRLPVVM